MITQPNRESMTGRRVVLLSSALLLAPGALPAAAGEYWQLYRHHDRFGTLFTAVSMNGRTVLLF